MIILDTCIMESFKLESVGSDLLKTIRRSKVERVAVPWAVMAELISHRAVPYRRKHEDLVNAMRRFSTAAPPHAVRAVAPPLNLSDFERMWRARYEEIAEVLPTSRETLMEALRREVNLLPPCKAVEVSQSGATVKTGGRDAAIWLTAVEYARNHPDEKVYFVSRNTSDFGDGRTYPEPMQSDLDGLGDRFVHLTSLAEVVEQFATTTEVDESDVERFLSVPATLRHVSSTAYRKHHLKHAAFSTFECTPLEKLGRVHTAVSEAPRFAGGWLISPVARLSEVRDVTAYRIGEHIWCMATVRWLLAGAATLSDGFSMWNVGTAWDTRVLLSTTEGTPQPTLLRTSPPKAVPATEFADFPDLPRFEQQKGNPWSQEATVRAHVQMLERELVRLQERTGISNLEPLLLQRSQGHDDAADDTGEESSEG
ncbi:PIN domain-containing protein [Streptomyces sp. NPDC021969]|uniref:PIN domain-containing protein n=1 Tax=unclassified Streptomyces TaxID=2593676 RepID=UPI0033E80852